MRMKRKEKEKNSTMTKKKNTGKTENIMANTTTRRRIHPQKSRTKQIIKITKMRMRQEMLR
jgi:hypothetical protein